jgi:diguanylate cyclase (GGDEF)-like protein
MKSKPITHGHTLSVEQLLSLAKATLESSNDGLLVVTRDGAIIDYNQKFAAMWQIPKKVLETRDEKLVLYFVHDQLEDPDEFLSSMKEMYHSPETTSIDILRFKDKKIFERYSHPYLVNGELLGRIWSFRDITRRIKLEEDFQFHMIHDHLTGLPNRLHLFDRMRQAVNFADRNEKQFALFVLDLDRFKKINDSLTHTIGDELLRAVGKRLQAALPEEDTIARIGGDEFVIVCTAINDEEEAAVTINKLLETLSNQPFVVGNRAVTINASAGVSMYPRDGKTIDMLLRNADSAMYRAKEKGSDRFEFYLSEMNAQALEDLDQEMQLRYAIHNDQFKLLYQPQIDIITGELVGVEALVRWEHPEKGLLVPSEFIPVAEETGLIITIDDWVLKTACLQAKAWQDAGISFFRVAVNVTPEQFKRPDLVGQVSRILKETGVDPKYIELEITENVIINTEDIIGIISALKETGVQITLDDFGTGYSSLSYLKKIPLDRLKIDKSFIQHIPSDRDGSELVRAIIAMSKVFGLEILAEGVETGEQLEFLKLEKCKDVQGYYFSMPLSVAELEKFILMRVK